MCCGMIGTQSVFEIMVLKMSTIHIIGGIYRLLSSGATVDAIVNHLISIETGSMGMSPVEKKKLEPIAEKLLKLDVSLKVE